MELQAQQGLHIVTSWVDNGMMPANIRQSLRVLRSSLDRIHDKTLSSLKQEAIEIRHSPPNAFGTQ
jgi:hypothetical protein